jgi:hypothetical protein
MPRIRSIKPDHWSDKELPNISLQAHLLWIGLWNFSDDEGIFENDLNLIKSQIFPRRQDIRVEQIKDWLGQLVKARYIIPFEYQNGSYYIHRTFKTHQKIDRPTPSKFSSEIVRRVLGEYSQSPQGTLAPESIGKDSKGEDAPPRKKFTERVDEQMRNKYPQLYQTQEDLHKILMADELWVEEMQRLHRGKDLAQAIGESFAYMKTLPARFATSDLDDWKRLVQSWLPKMKPAKNGQTPPGQKPKPVKVDDFVNNQLKKLS